MKKNRLPCGHFFSSIRSKFVTIFVILGVIPLILVGFFAYKIASNALVHQTREQLGNLAEKTAQQIDTFFDVCKKDINLLSNFPFIQLAFLQFEFGQKLNTARRLLEEYERGNRYCKRIHLADLDGRPIISIPSRAREKAPSFSATDWFGPALENDIFLSDVIMDKGFDHAFLVLTKKIHDFEDPEKPVGLLVFEIRLTAAAVFVSSLKIGTKGYAFLLNNKGTLLYHPDRHLNMTDTVMKRGDSQFKNLVEKMRTGTPGFGHYLFGKSRKYMVFTPCRVKNWRVGITLEKSEFMADIIKLRQSIVTFSALIVILMVLVSFLFVKSLTQPVHQLVESARAIGAGDLDQRITVASSDEFSGLAREFNRMAARLKKSMQKIVDLKTFSDNTLRSVSSGIITVDRTGRLTSINQSAKKILSFDREEIDPAAAVAPGVKKSMALLMMTLGRKQVLEHQVIDFTGDRGDQVFIEVNTSLLYDGQGEIIGAIADIRDVTARKRIDQLMIRVDKLASLGELSAGIAHEIRNPLAGMKTSIQVLAKRLSKPSHLLLVKGILSEIDRLNDIVTDLLKFAGSSPNYPSAVDLKEIIQKTLDLLMERIKKLNIRIVQNYEADIPRAFIDKEQIQQVCLNLMLNAVNAMPRGGTLTLGIKKVRDQDLIKEKITSPLKDVFPEETAYMAVSFSDTGCGISRENLTRVFDPFFTTDPNGTGLGLSIAHKLLEKNKAFIYLESEPGSGCRVTLIIPVHDDPKYPEAPQEPELRKESRNE